MSAVRAMRPVAAAVVLTGRAAPARADQRPLGARRRRPVCLRPVDGQCLCDPLRARVSNVRRIAGAAMRTRPTPVRAQLRTALALHRSATKRATAAHGQRRFSDGPADQQRPRRPCLMSPAALRALIVTPLGRCRLRSRQPGRVHEPVRRGRFTTFAAAFSVAPTLVPVGSEVRSRAPPHAAARG